MSGPSCSLIPSFHRNLLNRRWCKFSCAPVLPSSLNAHFPISFFSYRPSFISPMYVFDRQVKLAQRARAASLPDSSFYDYLRNEVAERLIERLHDLTKKQFPDALDLGANTGNCERFLGTKGGIQRLTLVDSSKEFLHRDNNTPLPVVDPFTPMPKDIQITKMVHDEENLPFPESSFDLVYSSLSLHWMNNLPGIFDTVHKTLKPDGVFIAALLGGDTLQELRSSLSFAENEILGGVRPHVSPYTGGRDLGDLLQRSDYEMPTIDMESLTIHYPDMLTLMYHLQRMGENNANATRPVYTSKKIFDRAAKFYAENYTDEEHPEKWIMATFQVFYIIGWKKGTYKPKQLERGVAEHSMAELDEIVKDVGKLHQCKRDNKPKEGAKENESNEDQNKNS